jgi:very-short-patch-repair endonuclease
MRDNTPTPLSSGVVCLQRVSHDKLEQARRLRRSMTPAEQVLWERLRGNRLLGLKFRRQQVIDGFIVDFFCNAARLVVEIDGTVHERPAQKELDALRRTVFEKRGLAEIRFANNDVLGETDWVVESITVCARERLQTVAM